VITYRAPRPDEVAALADLGRDTFVETFAHLYRAEDLNAFLDDAYSLAGVEQDAHNPDLRYRVAVDNGRLIAFCKVGIKPSLGYDAGDQRVVELKQLYVRGTHLGSGIAPVMMDWALGIARDSGADLMILSVYCDNVRAQRFYARYGFEKVADTYFMVGTHRDDEYILARRMTQDAAAA